MSGRRMRSIPSAVQRHVDEKDMWAKEEEEHEQRTKNQRDEDQILKDVEQYGRQGGEYMRDGERLKDSARRRLQVELGIISED